MRSALICMLLVPNACVDTKVYVLLSVAFFGCEWRSALRILPEWCIQSTMAKARRAAPQVLRRPAAAKQKSKVLARHISSKIAPVKKEQPKKRVLPPTKKRIYKLKLNQPLKPKKQEEEAPEEDEEEDQEEEEEEEEEKEEEEEEEEEEEDSEEEDQEEKEEENQEDEEAGEAEGDGETEQTGDADEKKKKGSARKAETLAQCKKFGIDLKGGLKQKVENTVKQ